MVRPLIGQVNASRGVDEAKVWICTGLGGELKWRVLAELHCFYARPLTDRPDLDPNLTGRKDVLAH